MKSVFAIAPGVRLTRADVTAVLASDADVMAIANVYELAPNANFVYASDGRWWDHHWHRMQSMFKQRMLTCEAASVGKFGADGLEYLEHVPDIKGVASPKQVSGLSSGEHALHFLVNEGYEFIGLLGYEYGAAGEGHYFGSHPPSVAAPSDWPAMVNSMTRLSAYIAEKGVRVVNCTEVTALKCFRDQPLNEVLESLKRGAPKTRRAARQEAVNPASSST